MGRILIKGKDKGYAIVLKSSNRDIFRELSDMFYVECGFIYYNDN